MTSRLLCRFLLLAFLTGEAVLMVTVSDDVTRCELRGFCQAMAKLTTAVNEINNREGQQDVCPGLNAKLDKQAKDLEELKKNLDRSLASAAAISRQLEKLSADLSRHDERLKAYIESPGAARSADKLLQSIYGAELGPRDCTDIRAMGNSTSGIYRVYPGSDTRRLETDIYCDFSSPTESWLVFQRRFDGSQNFDRTWREYERGFGVLMVNFGLVQCYFVI